MAGAMATDPERKPTLNVSREPVGPRVAGDKGSPGDRALMDAIAVVIAAWVVLLLLVWSLRSVNM